MSTSTPDPLEVAVFVSHALAVHLAKSMSTVPPFGLALQGPDSTPKTYFPRDENPLMEWSDLVDKTVETLRGWVTVGDVLATAVVSEVESSGGARGFATQIESAGGVSLLIYPYRIVSGQVEVDEPKYEKGLVMFSGTFPLAPDET